MFAGIGGLKFKEDWANRLPDPGKESGSEERLKRRKEGEAPESRVKGSSISLPLSPVPLSRPDATQGDVAGGNPSCLSLCV